MAKTRIAIVGLGAIGGSIGMALRQAEADVEVIGHDKEPLASRRAQKVGAVDKTHWNLISACEGADLVILAIPLLAIRDTLKVLGSELRRDCVVMDTATVKDTVEQWAAELLPETVHFVGTDPIVGTDTSGPDAATADLFKGATWCITSSPGVPSDAIQLVADVVTLLGAKPYFVNSVEHDGLLAATDHLPLVVAAALLKAVAESPSLREMSKLGGAQFAQVTLPVTVEVETARDICVLNRENIVRWLDFVQTTLQDAREIVASGDQARVEALFEQAHENRIKWLMGEDADTPPIDYRGGVSVGSMLFGRIPRFRRPSEKK